MFQNISADRLETLLDQGGLLPWRMCGSRRNTGRDIWREL